VSSAWRERLHLSDPVEAAGAIAAFTAGLDQERFVGDDLVRDSPAIRGLVARLLAKLPDGSDPHSPER